MNFDRPGGFRWLDSWVMGSIVQLATFRFCEPSSPAGLTPMTTRWWPTAC